MSDPVKVMISRFPYGASEHPDVCDWLIPTAIKMKADDRIGEIITQRFNDTPITMTRNLAMKVAREHKADFILLIDSDQAPDIYVNDNPYKVKADPLAKPFWDSTFDFMLEHRQNRGPCCVAAPYMGPPPHENVYVFRWRTYSSDDPNQGFSLEQWTREEAALARGIEQVAALPTGLMLLDVQALDVLKKPYFYYEYTDEAETQKASTEDVTFTRDLSLNGVPCYCNWDAWAGHHKLKNVGRPIVLTNDIVSERMRRAAQTPSAVKPRIREELMLWTPGKGAVETRKDGDEEQAPVDPLAAGEPPTAEAANKRIGMVRTKEPELAASIEEI